MTSPDMKQQIPSYVSEYRSAFVPFTTETDGVITDVATGNRVDLPATHPNYPRHIGFTATQAVGSGCNVDSVLASQRQRERELEEARDRELGYVAAPSMMVE